MRGKAMRDLLVGLTEAQRRRITDCEKFTSAEIDTARVIAVWLLDGIPYIEWINQPARGWPERMFTRIFENGQIQRGLSVGITAWGKLLRLAKARDLLRDFSVAANALPAQQDLQSALDPQPLVAVQLSLF
jgi:hypothetical protein